MSKDCDFFSVNDKVVIVTGGTGMYGYYFCQGLAEAGATVITTSRDKQRAEKKTKPLTDKGLKVFSYSLDLTNDDSIEEFVSAVIRDHKKIDVLVNNARVPPVAHYEMTRENLEKSFATNLLGLMLITHRVIEEMKKTGEGNIINIGSIYGAGGQYRSIYNDPDANMSMDYPAQKGGLLTYTKQLATIFGKDNIRANCLSLGGVATPAHAPDFVERYNERTPLGRMAEGKDVYGPIVFLASDASVYMTGANLMVDGGWTAW